MLIVVNAVFAELQKTAYVKSAGVPERACMEFRKILLRISSAVIPGLMERQALYAPAMVVDKYAPVIEIELNQIWQFPPLAI